MLFIDTHAHLYDKVFSDDIEQIISRSLQQGVEEIYLPNCDKTTIASMLALAERWPAHCFPMIGLHPCYVREDYETELAVMASYLERGGFWGIGEVGLDKHWDLQFIEQQRKAFGLQIEWAREAHLPVIIHSREATADCIEMIAQRQKGDLTGIFHCFSGTLTEAKQITDLGFCLGIGGVATFKRSTLPDIIRAVGIDHLVLETDAPYLAPVPYRGKRNESSYLPLIAQQIADTLEIPLSEVAVKTTETAKKVFKTVKSN